MTVDDRCAAARDGGKAAAPVRDRPSWRQRLRTRIVSRGIPTMCGSGDDVSAAAVTDIPLVSGAVRLAWLKALGAVGVKNFVATSGLGYDFVCHTDDRANFPFYYPRAYQAELELCAAWLHGEDRPVVYDIGANGGFVSTHLAQMLAGRAPRIYAFEPVPTTFAKLTQSVQRLGLQRSSTRRGGGGRQSGAGPHQLFGAKFAARPDQSARLEPARRRQAGAGQGITLDGFFASVGLLPALVKIDVEGSEAAVLRGARGLLSRPDRPAILFEYNPVTLAECGASVRTLLDLLPGYALHYVDDLRGQAIPFGGAIEDAERSTGSAICSPSPWRNIRRADGRPSCSAARANRGRQSPVRERLPPRTAMR